MEDRPVVYRKKSETFGYDRRIETYRSGRFITEIRVKGILSYKIVLLGG